MQGPPADPDLAHCLNSTLRSRVEKLSSKARIVRSRLNHLIAYLDGIHGSVPAVVVGAEGEDIDFLVAEVLALESILARSRHPSPVAAE